MAFGQEMKEFIESFSTAYQLYDPKEEKRKDAREERAERGEDRADRALDLREDQFAHGKEQDAKGWAFKERQHQTSVDQFNRNFEEGQRQFGINDSRAGQRIEQADRQFDATQDYRWNRAGAADEQAAERLGIERQRNDILENKPYADFENSEDGRVSTDFDNAPSSNPYGGGAIDDGMSGGSGSDEVSGSAGGDRLGEPKSGPQIAKRLVSDLKRDFNMPHEIAVGVVGQLAGETGGFSQFQELNPMVPGSRGGFGYAQWTGPRRRNMEAYAKQRGLDPRSYQANYEFLRHELANDKSVNGDILNRLQRAGDIDAITAGRIFTGSAASKQGFLRPGIVNTKGRDNWTKKVASLFANGGMVRKYALGGLVEEEEDDLSDVDFSGPNVYDSGIPDEEPVTPEGNTEVAQADTSKMSPYERGRLAVREGIQRAYERSGNRDSAIDDPEQQRSRQNYARGYGASTPQLMRQAQEKVDPEGRYSPAERNLLAMGEVYNFYVNRGELGKAQEAAASMVQFHKMASQKFTGIAQAAAENGDLTGAAKAAMAAYANVPDGHDMSVNQNEDGSFTVEFTDQESKKTIQRKVMSPDDLTASIMGLDPSNFEQAILDAAGVPPEQFEGASVGDVADMSMEARAQIEEMVEAGELTGFNEQMLGDAAEIAATISTVRQDGSTVNSMDPRTAIKAIEQFISIDELEKDENGYLKQDQDFSPKYKARRMRGNGMVEVELPDGRSIKLPEGEFDRMERMREQNIKSAMGAVTESNTERQKDEASAERWDNMRKKFSDFITSSFGGGNSEPLSGDKRRELRRGVPQETTNQPAPAPDPAVTGNTRRDRRRSRQSQ